MPNITCRKIITIIECGDDEDQCHFNSADDEYLEYKINV